MLEEIDQERLEQLEKILRKKVKRVVRHVCTSRESAVAGFIIFQLGVESLKSLPPPVRIKMASVAIEEIESLFNILSSDVKVLSQISKTDENSK